MHILKIPDLLTVSLFAKLAKFPTLIFPHMAYLPSYYHLQISVDTIYKYHSQHAYLH